MHPAFALILLATLAKLPTGLANDSNYVRIDKKLRENLSTISVPENMEFARKYLDRTRETNSRFQVSLVESLEKFLSLEQSILPGKACTHESFTILAQNNEATGGRALELELGPSMLLRVDPIVHHFLLTHATLCRPQHPSLFDERLNQLDDTTLKAVHTLMQQLVNLAAEDAPEIVSQSGDSGRGFASAAYNVLLNRISYLGGEIHARVVRDVILELAKDDEQVEALDLKAGSEMASFVRKNYINSLFKRYIAEPCENYISWLSPVMNMIKLDRSSLGLADIESSTRKQESVPEAELKLESGIAHYQTCEQLVNRDRHSLLRNLNRWISKVSLVRDI